jgi:hypothetical protein
LRDLKIIGKEMLEKELVGFAAGCVELTERKFLQRGRGRQYTARDIEYARNGMSGCTRDWWYFG